MLVSTKSLDINIDFWGFDINLKVFLGTKLALSYLPELAHPRRGKGQVRIFTFNKGRMRDGAKVEWTQKDGVLTRPE